MKLEVQKKHFWIIVGISAVIVLAGMIHTALTIYFLRFYQEPPITYTNIPFPVQEESVRSGQPIRLTIERCSKGNYIVHVRRRIIDTIAYEIADEKEYPIAKGCGGVVRMLFDVPKGLPASDYYIEGTTIVTVRWLYFSKTREIPFHTEHFMVTD